MTMVSEIFPLNPLSCESCCCTVRYVLVYDLPWILSAVQKLIFTWIPDEAKKQIFFKTKKTIHRMIPCSNLPDYMGGRCHLDYRQPPPKVLPFRQLFRHQYSDHELDKIQEVLDSVK